QQGYMRQSSSPVNGASSLVPCAYSASYDAAGNMLTCAPSESASEQQLTWDNERRLTAWQDAPSSPTSTAQYLYDGAGNRVEQQATSGGTTTTTTYVGDLEQ